MLNQGMILNSTKNCAAYSLQNWEQEKFCYLNNKFVLDGKKAM